MITKDEIATLIEPKLEELGCFLVELQVRQGNVINVEIDRKPPVSINDCMAVNRHIEGAYDRDEEDFEVLVSSAGMDKPFRVPKQYEKNIGREVSVKMKDGGGKLKGILKAFNDDEITVVTRQKERVEGRKKKEWVETEHAIKLDDIKETKLVISF